MSQSLTSGSLSLDQQPQDDKNIITHINKSKETTRRWGSGVEDMSQAIKLMQQGLGSILNNFDAMTTRAIPSWRNSLCVADSEADSDEDVSSISNNDKIAAQPAAASVCGANPHFTAPEVLLRYSLDDQSAKSNFLNSDNTEFNPHCFNTCSTDIKVSTLAGSILVSNTVKDPSTAISRTKQRQSRSKVVTSSHHFPHTLKLPPLKRMSRRKANAVVDATLQLPEPKAAETPDLTEHGDVTAKLLAVPEPAKAEVSVKKARKAIAKTPVESQYFAASQIVKDVGGVWGSQASPGKRSEPTFDEKALSPPSESLTTYSRADADEAQGSSVDVFAPSCSSATENFEMGNTPRPVTPMQLDTEKEDATDTRIPDTCSQSAHFPLPSGLQTPPQSIKRLNQQQTLRRSLRIKREPKDDKVELHRLLSKVNFDPGSESERQDMNDSGFDEEVSVYAESQTSDIESAPIIAPLRRSNRGKSATKSAYFEDLVEIKLEEKKKRAKRAGKVSCIPFPPLDSDGFGLVQEEFCHEPFWVIIATIFLTLTHGSKALPVFRQVKDLWPTPEDLMDADEVALFELIKPLGLFKRLKQYKATARAWVETPPLPNQRHRVLHYPDRGVGKDIKVNEVVSESDPRDGAWEIGHIVKGPYALDSWRIFCRDIFLSKADGWNGENQDCDFEPEWMRVRPGDKELRAILRWMWLREGFFYNAETGEKTVASRELMEAAVAGKIGWDSTTGDMRIVSEEEIEREEFTPRKSGDCTLIWQKWEEQCERAADASAREAGNAA